ncbi:MAG: hypothetical protein WC824_07400 [Bacteroidota bacterium]|jgi:hypothetical protein
MKQRIFFFLVLPLLLLAACSDDDPTGVLPTDVTDDEYAVWSVTLDSMVVWEADDVVILQNNTDSYALGDSVMASYLKQQLKVPDDVLQNHVARNAASSTILRKLTLDVDYVLLSSAEIEAILTQGGYDELYRRYPKSNGVTTLSHVGFNATRTVALVYMSHTPGFLAGSGWAVLCRKTSGKWHVTTSTIIWVS